MPKTARYALTWSSERGVYELYEQSMRDNPLMIGDDDAWYRWLAAHTAFSFQGQSGRLNLLKEARKSGSEGYWYAYRSQGKRTVKRYVGRTADLTVARLEKIRRELDGLQVGKKYERAEMPAQELLLQRSNEGASSFSQGPLLTPKFHLPRLHPSLLLRERLLLMLDQGLEHKLTLVSAAAGSGKTALLSQWIAVRGELDEFPRVAWVSLDPSDNDPVRFWRYIMTACQNFQGDLAQSSLALLHAAAQPPFEPTSLEVVLTELLNALAQSQQRGILVLQDYHVITSPQIHETFLFFLDHLPTTVHVIMLTRSDPPFPLARLRARHELFEIRAADLRFSLDETTAFLRQSIASPVKTGTIHHLHSHLEGWATGLHLVNLMLQRQTTPEQIEHVLATFTGSHHSLQEYFVTEVLNTQPEPLQRFLLQTSVLSRLTVSLCDAVTQQQESEQFFALLERANLFFEPLDSSGQWYRYHVLFAEAMRAEARRRLGDDLLQTLSSHASGWYEVHGLYAEAIDAALYAQDYARSAVLIEQHIEAQHSVGEINEYHVLHDWLKQLPEAVLKGHPVLCLSYAVALLFVVVTWQPSQFTLASLEKFLHMAEESFRAENNLPKLGELLAFRSLLAWRLDDMDQAALYARQALVWLPEEQQAWRGLSLSVVGKVELLHKGQFTTARAMLQEAYALCEAVGNRYFKRTAATLLARLFFELGEIHRAAEYYHQALVQARVCEHGNDAAHALSGLAYISYEWNDLEAAQQQAQEALALGQYLALEFHEVHATLTLALVQKAQGQIIAAQQRVAALITRMPASLPNQPLHTKVQVMQAILALAAGDFATVQRWANNCQQHRENLPLFAYVQEELLMARWLMAQNKDDEALSLLERLLITAREAGHIHRILEIQLEIALVYAARKQMPEARQVLLEMLPQALAGGYLRLFLDAGERMAVLLRSLVPHLQEKSLLAYVQTILQAFPAGQTSIPASPAPSLAGPLSQQELRVLRLLTSNLSNAEIARELVVSVNTIRTQIQSIYRKLSVHNRRTATEMARQLQLL